MKNKENKLIGILIFSSLATLAFWHLDLTSFFEYGRFEINSTSSISYQIIDGILDPFYEPYYHSEATERLWVLSQIIPIVLAWKLRNRLGKLIDNIYSRI